MVIPGRKTKCILGVKQAKSYGRICRNIAQSGRNNSQLVTRR